MLEENNSGMTEADSSTDEQGGDDVIPINEVSDEDLAAFLEAEREQSAQEPEPIDTSNKQTPEPLQTAKAEEVEKPITRAELNALLERLNSQEKKVNGQELLIQRRTSELGEIKKRLQAIDSSLTQKYQEALKESPADALDIRDAIKDNRKQLAEIEHEEKSIERRTQAQELVFSHVPKEDFDVEAMAEALSADGIPPQYIESFKQDPIGFLDGDYNPGLTLIHVAKRARAEKVLKQLYPIAKQLANRVKELEGKQGEVLKKVQHVAKQTPQINASGSRPSRQGKSSSLDVSQIHKLSDAELEEILANEK